jgi:glycosyltransferase involved in cell wall biosynthesis
MLIPIEPDMFGNYLHLAWFVGLMSLLNASGKHITSVLHQVKLDDIKYPVSKVKTRLSAFVLNLFYSSVLAASTDTIVFERVFKARLEEQCIQKRLFDLAARTHLLRKRTGKPSTINQKLPTIHVVPHAVETLKRVPDQQTAKKRLRWNPRHKYVLCFGFITAQKGLDRLIEMWEPNKKVHLILAGGENPLYAKHKSYKKFVKKVRDAAQKKHIQVTGFVPEKKIATYFAASDLVILPYSRLTASSGPLSLAFAAEKPVLFSEGVADYFETSDFRRALAEIKLTKKEFVFRFTPEDFQQHLKEMLTHLPQAAQFSRSMKELRNWSNISNLYVKLLNR